MPTLPNNPDLEHFRRAAKALLRAARADDPAALAALADRRGGPPTLAAAQHAVARAHGFPSWPRLRTYLDTAKVLGRDPTREDGPAADAVDRFCRLACLAYGEKDGPERWSGAAALLRAEPDLPDRSIAAAAAAVDPVAIARHLAREPAAAAHEAGPHRWTPLLYLTYSRVHPAAEPVDRFLDCARLLLRAGADPDDGYLWSGLTPPFTALTGVFGEGEQGPGKQPRHPHEQQLARLLLRAGADPNDGQALYNRMFRPDDGHLVLLFEFGLGRGRGGPWARRLGNALESPQQMLRRQLAWAIDHGFDDRVRLLIAHGVDVRGALPDGRTAAEHAVGSGRLHLLPGLIPAGAGPTDVDPADRLAGQLLHPHGAAQITGDDTVLDTLRRRRPDLIHHTTTPAAVAAVAAAGFDVNARSAGRTALHSAAFAGDIDMLNALLATGADPTVRDDEHHGTPLQWALYARQPEAVSVLEGPAGPGGSG